MRALMRGGTRGAFGGVRGPWFTLVLSITSEILLEWRTYKWKPAVRAPTDLWLIDVDKDPWVSEGSAASVAGYGAVVYPANGLLVDEFDGGVWAGLTFIR
jgi:hypothetical protein